MADLPKDKPIVLYCASGARSAQAARILKRAGFTDVINAGSLVSMPREPQRICAIGSCTLLLARHPACKPRVSQLAARESQGGAPSPFRGSAYNHYPVSGTNMDG
jgi:hypothetical protein